MPATPCATPFAAVAEATGAADDAAAAAATAGTPAADVGPSPEEEEPLVTAAWKACQACASCLEAIGAAAGLANSKLTAWDAMPWRACKARCAHMGPSSCTDRQTYQVSRQRLIQASRSVIHHRHMPWDEAERA